MSGKTATRVTIFKSLIEPNQGKLGTVLGSAALEADPVPHCHQKCLNFGRIINLCELNFLLMCGEVDMCCILLFRVKRSLFSENNELGCHLGTPPCCPDSNMGMLICSVLSLSSCQARCVVVLCTY